MTHLPPFRTRQSAATPATEDDTDFDELPLLGEDAILERGAPLPDPDAGHGPPWDEAPADAHAARPPAPTPEVEDEAVAELLRDLNDVVPAATLAGAWAAQYESASRRTGAYAAALAPPVLTEVLHEPPLTNPRELPSVPPGAPWTHAEHAADDDATHVGETMADPDRAALDATRARVNLDDVVDEAYLPRQADAIDDPDETDDPSDDTGLSAADERLAEHIAESVMAALLPTLHDTVLDAVRDTLAARRHRG